MAQSGVSAVGASARHGRGIAVSANGVSKFFLLIDEGDAFRITFGSARNIEKFDALSDVSLRAAKGQFVGILGRNGAGKTTLLRTLGGIYAPDAGAVEVSGALSAIYELGVAGNPFLTGRQYAERMLVMRGVPTNERCEMLADVIDFCELGERIDDRIQSYSTGMAARLYFAVATAGFYDVYLIDEVLTVGDQYFQAKCWRRIKQRLECGASGVLVTQDWTTVIKVCSEAHIMDAGRIVYSGPPELVARRYVFGDELVEPREGGVARFLAQPQAAAARAGEGFVLTVDVEIQRPEPVYVVVAIDQLRTGVGWGTLLMSREPDFVGDQPGCARVALSWDALPLPPGEYALGVSLVQPRGRGRPRRIFDSFGWLSGSAVALSVEPGQARIGATLPSRWELSQP